MKANAYTLHTTCKKHYELQYKLCEFLLFGAESVKKHKQKTLRKSTEPTSTESAPMLTIWSEMEYFIMCKKTKTAMCGFNFTSCKSTVEQQQASIIIASAVTQSSQEIPLTSTNQLTCYCPSHCDHPLYCSAVGKWKAPKDVIFQSITMSGLHIHSGALFGLVCEQSTGGVLWALCCRKNSLFFFFVIEKERHETVILYMPHNGTFLTSIQKTVIMQWWCSWPVNALSARLTN